MTQAKSTTPQTDRPSATSTLSYDVYRAACPTRRVLDLIADKWTALIVGLLADRPHLFGELRSAIEGISAKVLAQKLRLLESDGLHEEGRFVKPKVAILGRGNVGGALAKGLEGAGYEVRTVGHEPSRVRETAAWGDIVILAVPYSAVDQVLAEVGDTIAGKTVVDVTNPLTPDYQLAVGFNTSAAEQVQAKSSRANVVKAFNYLFAPHMSTGKLNDTRLTLFVAGDNETAKDHVRGLGRDIGFDPVDAGPLTNARWLEALGYLNIQLGFMVKMGTNIGFTLVH